MPKPVSSTSYHIRITTLIAVLAANLALFGFFTPSDASAAGLKEIYGYSCCAGGFGTVNYHPGEISKSIGLGPHCAKATRPRDDQSFDDCVRSIPNDRGRQEGVHGIPCGLRTDCLLGDHTSGLRRKNCQPGFASARSLQRRNRLLRPRHQRVKGKNSSGGYLIFSVLP